ncbi:hypothetical protein BDZ45DRAFT_805612 [Acephala macrosclerotiorum]|nr:hypothetical protein BDZ45DRAFT_805612 [Acephala macrosclerotiorum]
MPYLQAHQVTSAYHLEIDGHEKTPGFFSRCDFEGNPIYSDNDDHHDPENHLPATTRAVTPACSLIKAFIAASLSVHELTSSIFGTENSLLVSGHNYFCYFNNQYRLLLFGWSLSYNNTAFEIAGEIIEALDGASSWTS